MKHISVFTAVMLLVSAASATQSLAAGKKRPKPGTPQPARPLKKVVRIDPIRDRFIELADPDAPMRVYGKNIFDQLVAELKATDNYVILLGGTNAPLERQALALKSDEDPDPCNINSTPVPSMQITARVDEISFQTGSRGGRMLYGFKRGYENPYNAGYDPSYRNEFPLRKVQGEPGWFGQSFADTGGLHDGLELQNEINFDVMLVGAKLKHAEYHASLALEVNFRNRVGSSERRLVTAEGSGFFFDLSGHLVYEGVDWIAGFGVAREVAFLDSFKRVVKAMVGAIGAETAKAPLLTRLASRCDGNFYVAVGANYRVAPGQRFYSLTQLESGQTPAVYTVEQVFQTTARVRVEGTAIMRDELVSLAPGEAVPQPKATKLAMRSLASGGDADLIDTTQTVSAGNENFSIPELLKQFAEGFFTKLWNGIKALVTLPYRAWRYFQYDQGYEGGEVWEVKLAQATKLASRSWGLQSIGAAEAWTKCPSGKDCLGARGVIVAVLDSGIDYNHKELRRNIFWDGTRDTPGWDFISGDARPYDDHAHGSEIASVIAGGGAELIGVAPNVTLLPVKVFNPYGLTSSAALYSGFEYAISMGAKIIVTGWATPHESRALKDALKMAHDNGVLVVAAAGEGGFDLSQRSQYPAAYKTEFDNVLVAAALAKDGGLVRTKGNESNYGAMVDLAAPGEQIRVANPRNKYRNATSTAISSGYVAGSAALVWSRCPKAPVSLVKQALVEGVATDPDLRGEVSENKRLSVSSSVDKIAQICK